VTDIDRKDLTLSDIKELLRADIFAGEDKLDMPVRGGAASDLMSDMLTGQNSGVVLLTGLCNVQSIRTAVIADVAAVILVRGKRTDRGDDSSGQGTRAAALLDAVYDVYILREVVWERTSGR
jgi:hypothetical protein